MGTKEEAPDEVPGDKVDHVIGTSNAVERWLDKIHLANKAIIAAVGAGAALAISLGWGNSELWAQITAVVVALLTVIGVFAVANDEPST